MAITTCTPQLIAVPTFRTFVHLPTEVACSEFCRLPAGSGSRSRHTRTRSAGALEDFIQSGRSRHVHFCQCDLCEGQQDHDSVTVMEAERLPALRQFARKMTADRHSKWCEGNADASTEGDDDASTSVSSDSDCVMSSRSPNGNLNTPMGSRGAMMSGWTDAGAAERRLGEVFVQRHGQDSSMCTPVGKMTLRTPSTTDGYDSEMEPEVDANSLGRDGLYVGKAVTRSPHEKCMYILDLSRFSSLHGPKEVCRAMIGRGGQHMKDIVAINGELRLRVRGRGSEYNEAGANKEANMPLSLTIAHADARIAKQAFLRAMTLRDRIAVNLANKVINGANPGAGSPGSNGFMGACRVGRNSPPQQELYFPYQMQAPQFQRRAVGKMA